MKVFLRRLSIFLCILLLKAVPVYGGVDEDFQKMISYFRERNYPVVKNLAKELISNKKYLYQTSIILSEVYFQENDLTMAEDILRELLTKFPQKEKEINRLIEKIEREKNFLEKGVRDRNRKYEVFFSEESKEKDVKILEKIVNILDDALYYGGKFFGWYPDYLIKVMVYYGEEYRSYTVLPPWSSGGFDGKIRLKITKNIKGDQLREIIYHEYAHLAIDGLTKGKAPLWFNEGVAQYFVERQLGKLSELKRQVVEPDRYLKNLRNVKEEEVEYFYKESLNTVKYITKSVGEYVIVDILNLLGQGKDFKDALNSSISYLGLSYEVLFN